MKTITWYNLVGGFCGGALGMFVAWLISPWLYWTGCLVGGFAGYNYQRIADISRKVTRSECSLLVARCQKWMKQPTNYVYPLWYWAEVAWALTQCSLVTYLWLRYDSWWVRWMGVIWFFFYAIDLVISNAEDPICGSHGHRRDELTMERSYKLAMHYNRAGLVVFVLRPAFESIVGTLIRLRQTIGCLVGVVIVFALCPIGIIGGVGLGVAKLLTTTGHWLCVSVSLVVTGTMLVLLRHSSLGELGAGGTSLLCGLVSGGLAAGLHQLLAPYQRGLCKAGEIIAGFWIMPGVILGCWVGGISREENGD